MERGGFYIVVHKICEVRDQLMDQTSISVRKFKQVDAKELMKWGVHEDIRFLHYNYPYKSNLDHMIWYKTKSKFFSRRLFAVVKDESEIIGYIILKRINWFKRSGEMGIAMDVNSMGKGYGPTCINQFLDIVFSRMHFNKVWLRTSDFNIRAQKTYEKVGFKLKKKVEEEFEEQNNGFKLVMDYDYFKIQGSKLITLYHYMEISREEYLQKFK